MEQLNFTELLISNLLGLVIGLATSFFSWWVLFHGIVPAIKFASAISKIPRKDGTGHSYRVKLANSGRRGIIGLEVQVRATFRWDQTSNRTGLYIPLGSEATTKYELPRLDPGKNRVLTLWINKTPTFRTNARYAEDFRQKVEVGQLTLEDVLNLGLEASIQIFVSGYDALSGARKVYVSREYTKTDIVAGRFKGLLVEPAQTEAAEALEVVAAVNIESRDGV